MDMSRKHCSRKSQRPWAYSLISNGCGYSAHSKHTDPDNGGMMRRLAVGHATKSIYLAHRVSQIEDVASRSEIKRRMGDE